MPAPDRFFHRLPILDLLTVVSVLGLWAAAAVLVQQVQTQASAAESVTRAREVLQCVTRANLAITQAEGSERGFLLSGDLAHVERYEAARQESGEQLQQLAFLTRDSSQQQAVLAHLMSETERRLDILRGNIDRRRAGTLQDVDLQRDGAASTARLAGYSAQLQAEGERLLGERRASALGARRGIRVSAGVIVGLAVALATVLLLRALAQRRSVAGQRAFAHSASFQAGNK
jgi:CHASE3 domain sensor protein